MNENLSNEMIATKWFDAFNRHDLADLLDLYDDNAIHLSPKLKMRYPETNGLIKGKNALREWWHDSFTRLPGLHYEIRTITPENEQVFLEYLRKVEGEQDSIIKEVLEIKSGKIIKSEVC